MPHNIEIKARIPDRESIRLKIEQIADSKPEYIDQTDTFYHSPLGRLKMRVFADGSGELILYHRDDIPGPKKSAYQKMPVSDVIAAGKMFETLFGIRGIVRKQRVLYMSGNTRIHLDSVEGLGDFIELEVMLGDDDRVETGTVIAQQLMRQLGIGPETLVDRAYIDLLFPEDGTNTETSIATHHERTE